MQSSIKEDLTEGSISHSIWKLAFPTMVSNGLFSIVGVVDLFFVGKLGPEAIATVTMGMVIVSLIWIIQIGITAATVAMLTRAFGAKEKEQAKAVIAQGLFMSLVSSVVISILGFIFAGDVLYLMGAAEEVVSIGINYVRILSLASIPISIMFLIFAVFRGAGDAVKPLKIFAIASVVHCGLDPLLIFGIGIFPQMGVAGSATAWAISRVVGMFLCLYILFGEKRLIGFEFKDLRFNPGLSREMIRIGFFQSLQMVIWTVKSIILLRIVAIFGTTAVAAFGIVAKVSGLIDMICGGLSVSVQTLVGQNLGAQKAERAEKSSWLSVLYGVLFTFAFGMMLFIFAKDVIFLFNSDPNIISIGVLFLHIILPTYIFLALSSILGGGFVGAGDTRSPTKIVGMSTALCLLLALLLAKTLNLGTNGIWIAIAVSNILSGALMTLWFKRGKWKNITFKFD